MMNETAAVSKVNVRKITVTAMLGALAAILMFFEFSVPFIMPGFIKMETFQNFPLDRRIFHGAGIRHRSVLH